MIAKSFDAVQMQVMELLQDRILIGHALKADLAVLKIMHPKENVRDTCLFEQFREKYGSGKAPSLKKIVQGELGISIQHSEHDSVLSPSREPRLTG
jgi:RNA exonuclease 4